MVGGTYAPFRVPTVDQGTIPSATLSFVWGKELVAYSWGRQFWDPCAMGRIAVVSEFK